MRRRSLLVLLSITLFGSQFATTGAREENFPIPKGGEASFPTARSDGTVGHMRQPDQNEVKKLVGYIREGMNHADRSERQKQQRWKDRSLIRIRR